MEIKASTVIISSFVAGTVVGGYGMYRYTLWAIKKCGEKMTEEYKSKLKSRINNGWKNPG